MRNAVRPSTCKVGTRSRKAMSSSMPPTAASRHELVAAGVRDQDRRVGGVVLHLLPQAVDVGFECVRGHARIVAPDFLQQGFARHRLLTGAIEITQDRGLFL